MKNLKYVIIFLFLIFILSVFSSKTLFALLPDFESYKYNYTYGFLNGIANSTIMDNDTYINEPKNYYGYNILIDFEIQPNYYYYCLEDQDEVPMIRKYNNKLLYGFRVGLGYIEKGFDLGEYPKTDEFGNLLGTYQTKVLKSYVIVPVNLTLQYKYFYIKSGFYSGYLINSKEISDINSVNFDDNNFKSFDFGFDGGVGLEFILSFFTNLKIDYTYQHGFYTKNGNNISHILNIGICVSKFY